MEEQLISFETAKLAKEKGFDEKCEFSYKEQDPVVLYQHLDKKYNSCGVRDWMPVTRKNSQMKEASPIRYSCPAQSFLQKWLRDTHKIHITVTSISQESWQYHITRVGEKLGDNCGEDYADYEAALEDGLLKALKLI